MTATGRFAPSPTGPLHLGSLTTAVASFLEARATQGRWLLRIDDIDAPRAEPGASDLIIAALEAHGLHWDEAITWQSQRLDAYQAAAEALLVGGQAFYCTCSRAMLPANAPYPGTCRNRHDPVPDSAIRVRCPAEPITFADGLQGQVTTDLASTCGDFVIWRRDGLPAYQLATAVDDGAPDITTVVRGNDLLDSTPRQLHLMRLLGLAPPRYSHLPVVVDTAGIKLSKRTGAAPLAAGSASDNLTRALTLLRQAVPADARRWPCDELLSWAIAHWDHRPLIGRESLFMAHS